ncbi:hypothetical protein [Cellulophaga sp. Z1A5H]|uniref:hypothetical protein n=1 Tax=Cellulophaga sp. Z1A5H TaxID=2687291 RepID=UPI0013FD8083|nr:hypothetical protein [Cellulophaga sp. Z1A5H]
MVQESFSSYYFYVLSLLVNKGQRKKLALIAIANELVTQSFAIAKSGRRYDEAYASELPR